MKIDYMSIGSSPPNESCIQAPYKTQADLKAAKEECQRYIAAIRSTIGEEPEGARLSVKQEIYDFGDQTRIADYYCEVVCYYEVENESATAYAYRCESEGPDEWPIGHRTAQEFEDRKT